MDARQAEIGYRGRITENKSDFSPCKIYRELRKTKGHACPIMAAKIHEDLQLSVTGRTGKETTKCSWDTLYNVVKDRVNEHRNVAFSSPSSKWRKIEITEKKKTTVHVKLDCWMRNCRYKY